MLNLNDWANFCAALQNQKAANAYFWSMQLLSIGFAEKCDFSNSDEQYW